MSRAPALAAAERRQEIIQATLPLLRQYGANVTTSQIARAAGVAEGTIFRVFEDKRELLQAALCAAMTADAEVARIGEISTDLPLEERLAQALAAVSDYQDRLWALFRVVRESGWMPNHEDEAETKRHPREQMARVGAAMGRLFEPEEAMLRLDPCAAAGMLLGLVFAAHMREHGTGAPALTADQLVDLFLHGVLSTREGVA